MAGLYNILLCQYDEDWNRGVSESVSGGKQYEVRWKVRVDDPDLIGAQVLAKLRRIFDEGHTTIDGNPFDPIPVVNTGECRYSDGGRYDPSTYYYSHLGYTDESSFPDTINCELIDPNAPDIWRVTATYKLPESTGPNVVDIQPLDEDPLKWPPVTWIEYIEDQEVLEVARCHGFVDETTLPFFQFFDIPHLLRGMGAYSAYEPGPIVNAAGQQTIDPQMELTHRIVFNVRVNFPNHYYAMKLNQVFAKTMHCSEGYYNSPDAINQWAEGSNIVPLIMGWPHGSWKFILAEPEVRNFRARDSQTIVEYCPTVIKFEIKLGKLVGYADDIPLFSCWNRLVLNNGQCCFKKIQDKFYYSGSSIPTELNPDPETEVFLPDPRQKINYQNSDPRYPYERLLFPTTAWRLQDDQSIQEKFKYTDTRTEAQVLSDPETNGVRPVPTLGDMQEVETSEPVNLNMDGTQSDLPIVKPNHIWYNNLSQADYFTITDYYGNPVIPTGITMPTFPWGEAARCPVPPDHYPQ